jgi:inhibitor of cysteine peptidase
MQYDERSNGLEISEKTNGEFEISLSEVRTAGYHWHVTEKGEPVLELLSETTIPNAGAVGGSGHHVWRFRAASLGETRLTFEYSRPWEKSAKPARTFRLKVRVGS